MQNFTNEIVINIANRNNCYDLHNKHSQILQYITLLSNGTNEFECKIM